MNRPLLFALLLTAIFATTTTAWTCNSTKIVNWRASCDKLGSDDEKCKNRACHSALHYLVEGFVRDCYVQSGLGPASDLDKYIDLDNYCHGETPAPKPVPTTTTPVPTTTTPVPTTTTPVPTTTTLVPTTSTTPPTTTAAPTTTTNVAPTTVVPTIAPTSTPVACGTVE
ncbi:hypothetical protein H257_17597 [Aphanomyces astaci]|uniref:Uncharacterized protein n=1 Tax=Aphanomyces astaci TaxID=112090 RepID=W4FE56_APHAT|nr:hypothetical protein H257_17597 [Aphanomyces astaci]ETV65787.1 hypothetical protein H257_17597 [Aphanomyces astaci]|eukprot:XP_009844762.1 hypothetical protein H257_17597 [Aphanomyces astaci]